MDSSFRLLRVATWLAGLGAVVLAVGVAHAQGRDPVAATELFTQGREMLKTGDFDKACPLFAESLRLDPAVGTALNLAECEERRGHLASALRSWQQAINLAEATQDERGQVAQQRYDTLVSRVPHLTIVLAPGAPKGTTVLREEVVLGKAALGRPLPLDPGKHVITVRAPDHEDAVLTAILAEGETKTLTVAPGPVTRRVAPPPKPVEVVDGSSQRTLAYVLGGVGAAGILAATVTGVMLLDSRKTVNAHCDDADRCDQEGMDAADLGRTLVPINTIAWAVGVAGLGAGTYLYLSAPSGSGPASGARPSGAYVQVGGSF
jgi:hypothetical protein